MHGFDVFHHSTWYPSFLGVSHPFFTIHTDTVFFTWVSMGVLLLLALIARYYLYKPATSVGHLIRLIITAFLSMIRQSLPNFNYVHFSFIVTIFCFIVFCNTIVFFPFLEEPTKDLNTTLALGVISFCFVQYQILRHQGIAHYLAEYAKMPLELIPAGPLTIRKAISIGARFLINMVVALLSFPLELLGKVASVVSLSFRLFGNIFGGSVITGIWKYFISGSLILQTVALISGINIILLLFFGVFEGVIQGFVFAILSLTYLSLGMQNQVHE